LEPWPVLQIGRRRGTGTRRIMEDFGAHPAACRI
jgi:hypothetical protein